MFSFFKKKSTVTDINWLGVDMHSHILPGIDDGAANVEISMRLVKGLKDLGYEKLIASPHIFKELYPNTLATINQAKKLLQQNLKSQNIEIKLDAGAEYMLDQDFNIEEGLCLLDEKHILIEMSYLAESPNINQYIFDLQIKGLQPILAHPERYIFYFNDLNSLKRIKDSGCLFQLNLLSIVGYYGKDVKRCAEILLKEKMYDLAGTDVHNEKHLESLTEAVRTGRIHQQIGGYDFKNKQIFPING